MMGAKQILRQTEQCTAAELCPSHTTGAQHLKPGAGPGHSLASISVALAVWAGCFCAQEGAWPAQEEVIQRGDAFLNHDKKHLFISCSGCTI